MNYLIEAYGGLDRHSDSDAAIKFALDEVFSGRRFQELTSLLSPNTNVASIGGDPGWEIALKQEKGCETWPEGMEIRAFVDPDEYWLAHPEFFCDRNLFEGYFNQIKHTFLKHHPEKQEEMDSIGKVIRGS